MSKIPAELIVVDQAFADILGLSIDAVKALPLRELSNRAFEAGYALNVSARATATEGQGKLHLSAPPKTVFST